MKFVCSCRTKRLNVGLAGVAACEHHRSNPKNQMLLPHVTLSIRIRWQAWLCCFQQLESYAFQEAILELSLMASAPAKTRQTFNANDNKYVQEKLIDATFR